jgi:transposase InsO family protein
MGWRVCTVMDERREFVLLAGLEGSNVSELCRRFGVSRQTGHKWLGRVASGEGLEDRSRKPLSNPKRCAPEIEQAVLSVREAHPAWGARKIANVLARSAQAGGVMPANSTVHAILVRHGRIFPKRAGEPAHLRFEREVPNELWQMDFKGSRTLGDGTRLHPLTVVDDHSRYSPCLQALTDETGASVKPKLEAAFRMHGLPQAFFVDNGNPWADAQLNKWTKFRVWLAKLGINLITARPLHPQSRGKIERFHRSMDDEIFALRPIANVAEAQRLFDSWRTTYNHERPHEGIAMARPAERYRPSPRPFPEKLPEPVYGEGEVVRKVPLQGVQISFAGRNWTVPKAFAGERLAIRPHDTDGKHGIYFGANLIKEIDLTS